MLVFALLRSWLAKKASRSGSRLPAPKPSSRLLLEALEDRVVPSQAAGSVYDPTTATWYLSDTNRAGAPTVAPFTFGLPGWIAVTGDWDGNGTQTLGAFDPT